MKVRYEAGSRFTGSTEANLTLLTLARLAKSGLLPAGTKAIDPVSAAKAAKLTQDQIDYFTYLYFNAGAGFGKKHLQSQGLAAVTKWVGPPPADNRIARFNALQRLSTQKLMDSLGLFPPKSPLSAPVA